MRFKKRAWTRVDYVLAAVCAVLIYGVMSRRGPGLYVFPLSIWVAGGWAPALLAGLVALPVALRRAAATRSARSSWRWPAAR